MNSLIVFVVSACLAYSASGCSCGPLSQKQAFDRADIVTKMNIVSKEENGTQLTYMANYLDIYKPQNQSHIFIPVPVVTSSQSAACGATNLIVGHDYLIAATYNEDKKMQINSCSGIPADGEQFSNPLGALQWKHVTPKLLKRLQTGKF